MIILLSEILEISSDEVIQFASKMKTFQFHKVVFEKAYQLSFANNSKFVSLIPIERYDPNLEKHEFLRRVFKKSRVQISIRNCSIVEIGILSCNSYKYNRKIKVEGSFGKYISHLLFNSESWKKIHDMMKVDKYMIIDRIVWGVEFKSELHNLLDYEGKWFEVLGLSPVFYHSMNIYFIVSSSLVK